MSTASCIAQILPNTPGGEYANTPCRCRHAYVPEAEQAGVPVHEDVPEVLEDGGEVYPEDAVVLELGGLDVVLDGPAAPQKKTKTQHRTQASELTLATQKSNDHPTNTVSGHAAQ